MNKIAEIMYGKVANIYETSRTLEEMKALFVPAALLVDVTNIEDVGVGYAVDYGSGLDTPNFIPPKKILPQTLEEKLAEQARNKRAELETELKRNLFKLLAGNNIVNMQTEYQTQIAGIDDSVAYYMPDVYPDWDGNSVEYKVGDRVVYDGALYKVLIGHTSQATWTPADAPSLFVKVLTATDSILEWQQPGPDNAYMQGDKVRYNNKIYESLIDNNVWKPDDYPQGWKEVEI